jgi:hypothetical protein
MDAKITGPDGRTFAATIANLTRASVFVQCAAPLPFRAQVTVAFDEIELRGEVGFVAREPAGVVVAFEVPALYRITLGALIEHVPVLVPESPWAEHTQPTPEDDPEPVTLGHVAKGLVDAAPAELAEELDLGDIDAEATSPWAPPPVEATARAPVVMPIVSDLADLTDPAPGPASSAPTRAASAQALGPPRGAPAFVRGMVADLGAPSTLPPPALDPSLLMEASPMPLPFAAVAPSPPRAERAPTPARPRAAALPVPTPARGAVLEPVDAPAPRTSVHLPASRGPIPRLGSTALPPLPSVARGVPPPRAATSSGRLPAAGLPAPGHVAPGLPAGLVSPTLSGPRSGGPSGPSTTGMPTPASGIVLASGLPAPGAGTAAQQRVAPARAASVAARPEAAAARASVAAPAASSGASAASTPRASTSAPALVAAAPVTAAPRATSVAAPSASTSPSTLPTLVEGVVQFARAADFAAEFRSNLQHGGIIARSTPLSIGSMHALRLVVPGVRDVIQIRARVGFLGEGTVGFMIDSFPLERPRIEAAVSEAVAAAPLAP